MQKNKFAYVFGSFVPICKAIKRCGLFRLKLNF